MKKFVLILLLGLMLVACSEKEVVEEVPHESTQQVIPEPQVEDVMSEPLKNEFIRYCSETYDVDKIARGICKMEELDAWGTSVNGVEEGKLKGFKKEITGFNAGVRIATLHFQTPFIAYVFEADNTEGLVSQLDKYCDLDWNDGMHADTAVTFTIDNIVFYAITPYNFELE